MKLQYQNIRQNFHKNEKTIRTSTVTNKRACHIEENIIMMVIALLS